MLWPSSRKVIFFSSVQPDTIDIIKSYNKAQGNYTKYGTNTDATFKETYTNVKSYYSDFLRNGSYTNLLASGTIGCNNQLTSGSNSSCETFK